MESNQGYTYVNRVEINSSVYDVLISFHQSSPIKDETGKIIGEEKSSETNIIMSPQHAKAFMKILGDQINWYEENFGEIDIEGRELNVDRG